ncbi:MAG: LysE family transporter, partial [Oscillospiraceae bacterium]
GEQGMVFILGVMAASATWFLLLTTVVTVLRKKINHKAITYINVICGSIIILFGIKILFLY